MDEFRYLSVLLSVILGLAVTQILKGFRGLLLSRRRIQIYWPVIGWAVLLLLLVCFQNWWSMFGMRNRHGLGHSAFAMVLLQTILIYMAAGLVFPDLFGEEGVDLKKNFYAHRRWFFSLGFATIAVSVCKSLVLDGRPPPRNGSHIPRSLRCNATDRRAYAARVVSQNACCVFHPDLCSLHSSALHTD
jgi:hypothetical protein